MYLFSTVISLLGYSVVILSSVQKVPQLMNVLRAGKADSISIASIQLDTLSYTIAASYGYIHTLSIYVYGEMIILLAQSLTLFFLVAHYNKLFSELRIQFAIGIYSIWSICILMGRIPELVLSIQLILSIPITTSSKLSQIWRLYRNKRTGQVSTYTYGIAAYGCMVRILTTIAEVGNYTILFNYTLAAVLNCIIIVLSVKYGEIV